MHKLKLYTAKFLLKKAKTSVQYLEDSKQVENEVG